MCTIPIQFDEYMYVMKNLKQSIFEKLGVYGCDCLKNEEMDNLIAINKLLDRKIESKSLKFGEA